MTEITVQDLIDRLLTLNHRECIPVTICVPGATSHDPSQLIELNDIAIVRQVVREPRRADDLGVILYGRGK